MERLPFAGALRASRNDSAGARRKNQLSRDLTDGKEPRIRMRESASKIRWDWVDDVGWHGGISFLRIIVVNYNKYEINFRL